MSIVADAVWRKHLGDGMRLAATFRRDLEAFRGHYPDYPIVPGNFLVATFIAAVNKWLCPWSVVCLRNVRFRLPVFPGNQFEIRVQATEPSRYDCRLTLGDSTAASTEILLGAGGYESGGYELFRPEDISAHEQSVDAMMLSQVPHRFPMLFVDRLPSDTRPGRVSFNFDRCHPPSPTTVIPLPIVVESAAQNAILFMNAGDRAIYILAGYKQVNCYTPIHRGSLVDYSIESVRQIGATAIVDMAVTVEGELCLEIHGMLLIAKDRSEL